jgi:hypothetical protein
MLAFIMLSFSKGDVLHDLVHHRLIESRSLQRFLGFLDKCRAFARK